MAQIPLFTDVTTRHQVYLERLKTQYQKEFEPFALAIAADIKQRLSGEEVTDWSRRKLSAQLIAISNMIDSTYSDWYSVWLENLEEFVVYEAGFEERALNEFIDYDFTSPAKSQLIGAMMSAPLQVQGPDGGKLLDPFFAGYTQKTKDRIEAAVKVGFAQGQSNSEIRKAILGTKTETGALDLSVKDANLVTRTAVQSVAGTARQELYKANIDVIIGYRWIATIDSRTSVQCRSLDRQVFRLGKGPLPPIHIGCRSSTVPEVDGRFKHLKKGATRPARGDDGVELVPQSKTYYQFLKEQDADFVESVLGPTRAKLLLDGGLSAGRFADLQLNKKFEPLTLEQMKQLEPLAFKRAGLD